MCGPWSLRDLVPNLVLPPEVYVALIKSLSLLFLIFEIMSKIKIMPYRLLKIKNSLLKYCSTEKELSKKKKGKKISPYLCDRGYSINTEFHTSKLYDNHF